MEAPTATTLEKGATGIPNSALSSVPEHAKSADKREDSAPGLEPTCELRFLMINGESFRLTVPASSTIHGVKLAVIDERPQELGDFLRDSKPSITSMPSKVEEIRILHLGKFLDDMKTLRECKFAIGRDNLTTVHISVKMPTSTSDDVKEKMNKKSGSCCVVM